MALVCNRVSKVTNYFKSCLLNKLSTLNKSDKNLFFPFKQGDNETPHNLSNVLHTYYNFKNCKFDQEVEIENNLYEKLSEAIEAKENFGNDSIVHTFKKSPTSKNKEMVIKTVKIMNEYPELFKKHDLEAVIKTLSDPNFYDIKSEISKGLNFFKKVPRNKIKSSLGLVDNSEVNRLFGINIDIENNIIVLTDKFNENRHIIFVELGHNGINSINLYQSLIKSMNPALVLVDQEPYEIVSNNTITDGKFNSEVEKIENFDNFANFKNFLKENESTGINLNLQIKNANVYSGNTPMEVESIIYHSLISSQANPIKRNVILFDLPHNNFIKSFIHYLNTDSNNNTLDEIKNEISAVNLLEMSHWLSVQETLGCKSCASFFNKSEVNWSPLHLEFLINKSTLPNSEFVSHYKSKKIAEGVKNVNKADSVMIFGSNILPMVKHYIKQAHSEDKNTGKFTFDFDDYFDDSDFNTKNIELISLGLHLKEKSNKFISHPPLKMRNLNEGKVKEYKKIFTQDYQNFYGVDKNKIEEIINSPKFNNESGENENPPQNKKHFSSRRANSPSTPSTKQCEPEKMFKSLFNSYLEIEKI